MTSSRQARHVFQYFKTSGGSAEMDVDGSSNAIAFKVTSPPRGGIRPVRVNFVIVDGGIGFGEFAGLNAALSNGLEIKWFDSGDTELLDFTDGLNIKTNEEFGALSGADAVVQPAAGDDSFPVRWTIAKSGLVPKMGAGDYLQITVQDDLTAITKMRAMLQGYIGDD